MDYTHYFGPACQWVGPAWASSTLLLFAVLIIWGFVWKGLALWISAKRNEKWWFAIFLVVNTIGILEIVYLVFIAKDNFFRRAVGLGTKE